MKSKPSKRTPKKTITKKAATKKVVVAEKVVRKPRKPRLTAAQKKKIAFRRRYLPIGAAVAVFILIFGVFNSQLLSTRVAYYLGSRQAAAALDAKTIASPISKNAPPQIIINSIKVNAPVIFESKNSENTFLDDLERGVVHYPNTALPGQEGNVVIFGHSSGVWWEPGKYKFVFTLLDKIEPGDKIFIDYKGTRYIYRVQDKSVVKPTNLTVLNQSNNHMLTLITCTPVGTSTNRLIIHAVQYVPKPVDNPKQVKPATPPAGAQGILPGGASGFGHNLSQIL